MNVWDALFTTHPTEPPQFGFTWYASTFALLFLTIYLAYRYRDNKVCQRFFQIIQAIQLISLYSWIGSINSRCQKACLFIIADQPCLQFSCFQVFQNQTIFCFAWNLRDDCSLCLSNPRRLLFPALVILSFIFGHLALLGNSLIYLLNNYDARLLDFKGILILTSLLNGLIFIVNLLTGGDYGFMTKPPLVGDHGLVVNYIIVTLFLTCAIFLFSKGFQVITQEKAERRLKIWQK